MVVPDGTMQKGKRLGAEGVGEGVYGPPRGLEGWMGGWEGVGLAGVRCCSRDQRQGKGASVALATGGGPSNQSQIAGTGCQRNGLTVRDAI